MADKPADAIQPEPAAKPAVNVDDPFVKLAEETLGGSEDDAKKLVEEVKKSVSPANFEFALMTRLRHGYAPTLMTPSRARPPTTAETTAAAEARGVTLAKPGEAPPTPQPTQSEEVVFRGRIEHIQEEKK